MAEMRKHVLVGWFALLGAILLFAAIGVVIYQGYLWLKLGEWVPMPLSHVLVKLDVNVFNSMSEISWIGLRKLVEWGADLSIAVWCCACAFLCAWVEMLIAEK